MEMRESDGRDPEGIGERLSREREAARGEWVLRLAAMCDPEPLNRVMRKNEAWERGKEARALKRRDEGEWGKARWEAARGFLGEEIDRIFGDGAAAAERGKEQLRGLGWGEAEIGELLGNEEAGKRAIGLLVPEGLSPGLRLAFMGISSQTLGEVREGLWRIGRALGGEIPEGLGDSKEDDDLREWALSRQRERLGDSAEPGARKARKAGL